MHEDIIKDIVKRTPSNKEQLNKDHHLDSLNYSSQNPIFNAYQLLLEAGPRYTEDDFLNDEERAQFFKKILTRRLVPKFGPLGSMELHYEYMEEKVEEFEKMTKREYELVEYPCNDGECLVLHEKTTDSKLGFLSLDHKSIGERIVLELNLLAEKLYHEQFRTRPISLDTHISDDDFDKFEEILLKHLRGNLEKEKEQAKRYVNGLEFQITKLEKENNSLKKELHEYKEAMIDKVQYGEDNLEKLLIQKGVIKEDWAKFDGYD